ncbi:MAG TPA: hypothetical protein VF941_23150 [Clostridia bacterium]
MNTKRIPIEEAIDLIFQDVVNKAEENIKTYRAGRLPDSSNPVSAKNGEIDFSGHLDSNGSYHFEAEKYGAGFAVHCTAYITEPDAIYSVRIAGSEGGGGHWKNVRPKQTIHCDIKTSIIRKTKVTVDINSTAKDREFIGKIIYSI